MRQLGISSVQVLAAMLNGSPSQLAVLLCIADPLYRPAAGTAKGQEQRRGRPGRG